MRLIPTQATETKVDGDKIVATIASGATIFEIEFSPHEAIRLGHALTHKACVPIETARSEAEIIRFPTKRRAKA